MKSGPKNRASEEIIGIITAQISSLRWQAIEKGLLFYEAKPKAFAEPLEL